MSIKTIAQIAKKTSGIVAKATTEQKNAAILNMAEKLASRTPDIIAANLADVAESTKNGLPTNMIDRLSFSKAKIEARIRALDKIEALPDPVGQPYQSKHRPNGLDVMRVRVPLGVILMIYEARPHITVNAGALCLKAGNSAILRGGSEAKRCNELLGVLWRESLSEAGLPTEAIQVISGSHEDIGELLAADEFIDLVIPRGGKGLIQAVSEKSKIPVIKHYSGVCHVYLDQLVDVSKGVKIALDSKCLMPEVCNAMETLLVSKDLSENIPGIVEAFKRCGVKVKGCKKTRSFVADVELATEDDWRTEYLDNIISIRVVADVDEAIEHINSYGSHHTDAIVTDSVRNADKFIHHVDSAVVLWNASTMFCDGESLGMGAEIGISTDKLHARGPMGLEELTSYKFVIRGDGHVMGDPQTFIKEADKN
ncbi:MAG: glutamate-5-semialdehyde dehydrogenase [Sedimentisphaerales bacterium]